MPIRTRRGRSAAYRALWEWPLHSPARFAAVVAAVAALVLGVSSLTGLGGAPSPSSTGPATAATAGAGTAATAPSTTAGGPALELTPTRLPLSAAPPSALDVARRWAQAWAQHPPGTTAAAWSAALAPLTTDEYLPTLASVDPANVPGGRVTGPPVATEVRPDSVRVAVPTDAVRLELLVVQVSPGRWRVAGYDRAS